MALIIPSATGHTQFLSLVLLLGGMAAVAAVNIRNFPQEIVPSTVSISSASSKYCGFFLHRGNMVPIVANIIQCSVPVSRRIMEGLAENCVAFRLIS